MSIINQGADRKQDPPEWISKLTGPASRREDIWGSKPCGSDGSGGGAAFISSVHAAPLKCGREVLYGKVS